jgi:predicted transglutaminase-like cysteine proteinase
VLVQVGSSTFVNAQSVVAVASSLDESAVLILTTGMSATNIETDWVVEDVTEAIQDWHRQAEAFMLQQQADSEAAWVARNAAIAQPSSPPTPLNVPTENWR